jgi:hypothetical protein
VTTEVPARVWFDPNTGRLQVTITDDAPGGPRPDVKTVVVRFERPTGRHVEQVIRPGKPTKTRTDDQGRREDRTVTDTSHTYAEWRVEFENDNPEPLIMPNEDVGPARTPGRYVHCMGAQELAGAEHCVRVFREVGATDIRVRRRTVTVTRGAWEDVEGVAAL